MSTADRVVNQLAPFDVPGFPVATGLDVYQVRQDFPALQQSIHGKPLVYLDNAATSQKPLIVIRALDQFYCADCANIHRGVHELSERATECYECSRTKVQRFLNARESSEIVFVRGTTEAINLVAQTYGRKFIVAGDEIVISALEHHSNIVPWQLLCEFSGAKLRVVPISDSGELLLEQYEKLLGPRTKLVSISHISNALGTVNPVKRMIEMAHAYGVPVMVDGAQSAPHLRVDVQELGADFFAFSGHKLYGPTGIGVLYGRRELLDRMPPYQGGGDMIRSVSFERTTYNKVPYKFEAGTPDIAGAIGLGAAIDYMEKLGMENIAAYERDLFAYAGERLAAIPEVRIVGTAREKASAISFLIGDVHPHDIGTILDQYGVAIRAGHHCAQPLMQRLGIPATARASFAFYNTREEVEPVGRGD